MCHMVLIVMMAAVRQKLPAILLIENTFTYDNTVQLPRRLISHIKVKSIAVTTAYSRGHFCMFSHMWILFLQLQCKLHLIEHIVGTKLIRSLV